MESKKNRSKTQEVAAHSKWAKAFTRDSQWSKSELTDVIYWLRQVFSIVIGLLWGLIPLKGAIGIAGFLVSSFSAVFVYYSKFLGVDEDEFGGTWELASEGAMSAFGSFLVSWIITYNLVYFS